MTITCAGISFTGPHMLSYCPTGNSSGLYAIMIKPDPTSAPDTYTIIYFGESGNFEERLSSSHHKYDCWSKRSGPDGEIYYGLHIMKNSTEEQRRELEAQLIERYKPVCND